jgi:hypothetical protein
MLLKEQKIVYFDKISLMKNLHTIKYPTATPIDYVQYLPNRQNLHQNLKLIRIFCCFLRDKFFPQGQGTFMSSDQRERADGGGTGTYLMSSDLRGECAAILEESLTVAKKGVEGAEEDILILVYL